MIVLKSEEELSGLRASGQIAARIRDEVAKAVCPGVTTGELAELAGDLMRENEAESAFLGYHGFPGIICVSVNETVVHGIPDSRIIEIGDIVSIDVGVRFGGFIGDTAVTVMVGVTDQDVIRLVRATEKSLMAAIETAKVGVRLSDVSHAIEMTAADAGCTVVRKFVGHGVGRQMHEDPQVPNFGMPGRGPKLRAGMTLCFEPMLNLGGSDVEILDDGWTVVTKDRSMSAHFEHMIAIRDEGPEILSM